MNTYYEQLDVSFNKIVNFVDSTVSNLSDDVRKNYENNLSIVSKNISFIEKHNYEIKRLQTSIRIIEKEFKNENIFVVIGLIFGLIVSSAFDSAFQYVFVLILGGIYLLYKNNDKNREILEISNKINSINGTISIIKRDLNILGIGTFCIENLIKYRNQNDDFYTDELHPTEKIISQSVKDKVGYSIVISDYQIKLFTIKYTLDSLNISYDTVTFDKYLNANF